MLQCVRPNNTKMCVYRRKCYKIGCHLSSNVLDIYRMTAVLKVETDTITNITACPIGRGAILVIIYVETLKLTLLFLSVMS